MPAAASASSSQEIIEEILDVLHDVLGMEVTLLSTIEGDNYHVVAASDQQEMGFHAGLDISLDDTF